MINFNKITTQGIRHALNEELPGAEAHYAMSPGGRKLDIPTGIIPKKSAILIPLFFNTNEIYTYLTKRNHNLKKHPGQISFPGGSYEPHDINTQATALRETHEEIGIEPENIEVLGKLSNLYIPVSNFTIAPYVGLLKNNINFRIDRNEVTEVIPVGLSELFHNQTHSFKPVKIAGEKINVPCYFINGNIIWGATSMILSELEAILERHYSHRAKR
ncbi:MAG: CoA pyrophosphatase [Prolixibacteraceae bacterium]|nr:CoA pyrophosphatase [Prolixibacteraceae bacterium]